MTVLACKARSLDAADPIADARAHFTLPVGVIYLDGNSLGALPKATPQRLAEVILGEWGEGLIRSWNSASDGGAGWIDLPHRVGTKIAPLIGARPYEVIACDSTSINLYKLIAAALALQRSRGAGHRRTILSETGNFPTDLYMIEGLQRQGLAERRLVDRSELVSALDKNVALLLLTHAHYRTGQLFDMAAVTGAAHEAGALVLWDLSHSVGAMPVSLDACRADLAVGCGYKFLCGGPGAPAFAFVAERHHAGLEQPLTGWFGHAAPFAFIDDYEPAPGIDRLQCGTPGVLGLAALEMGVDLIASIGVERLRAKSRALSEFFRECLAAEGVELELVSPSDPLHRSSQLSYRHHGAHALSQAMIARGVIGDHRAPDILRFGFAPAYLRYADIAAAAGHLAQVLRSGEWRDEAFNEMVRVT